MSDILRRIHLFALDLIDGCATEWSLARMHDCGRNGGHRWVMDSPPPAMLFVNGIERTCTRCGCSEWLPTNGTTATWFKISAG